MRARACLSETRRRRCANKRRKRGSTRLDARRKSGARGCTDENAIVERDVDGAKNTFGADLAIVAFISADRLTIVNKIIDAARSVCIRKRGAAKF